MPVQTDRLTVLGAGSWGTALAMTTAQNIPSVTLWGRDPAAMDRMHRDRCNKRYLPDLRFSDNLKVTADLAEAINPALCFLIVVPSHAFRKTLELLKEEIVRAGHRPENSTLVWGTKGFEPDTGNLLAEVALDVFGETRRQGVISGPSFASETAGSLPTALTLAGRDRSGAEFLSQWFRTPTTRVYHSSDMVGVQLGGAIKNVMAIAAGISDGLGYGANARAALITRGLSELTRLGIALGGQAETFMGLTGVGDLILTCTDDQSRNRRFGLGIGMGKSIGQIVDEIGQEIEGINTTRELYAISRKLGVDMPITEQVHKVLNQNLRPDDAVKRLLQRHPKAES